MNAFNDLTVGQYPTVFAIVHIKDKINDEIFDISIDLTNSVLDLKKLIEHNYNNISACNIRLVFSGHLLSDFFSLYSQGVKNDSIIYLINNKNDNFISLPQDEQSQNSDKISSSKLTTKIKVLHLKPTMNSIKVILINCDSVISRFDQVFSKDSIYIFKGEVLDKEKTIDYYGISDGNCLVCIPKDFINNDSNLINKWIKQTKDDESFQNYIDSNTNKNCRKEIAKHADIKFQKIELNKNRYYKTFNEERINTLYRFETKKDEIKLITDYKKPDHPSTNRLPFYVKFFK